MPLSALILRNSDCSFCCYCLSLDKKHFMRVRALTRWCKDIMLSSVSKPALSLQDVSKKNERSPVNEVHLVVMRLLSVFMSRTKSGSKSSICEVCSSGCFSGMGCGWEAFLHQRWYKRCT